MLDIWKQTKRKKTILFPFPIKIQTLFKPHLNQKNKYNNEIKLFRKFEDFDILDPLKENFILQFINFSVECDVQSMWFLKYVIL